MNTVIRVIFLCLGLVNMSEKSVRFRTLRRALFKKIIPAERLPFVCKSILILFNSSLKRVAITLYLCIIIIFPGTYTQVKAKSNLHKQNRQVHTHSCNLNTTVYDIGGIDVKGNELKLSNFKGFVVLVHIWFVGSRPSMVEIPHLMKLEEDYYDKPVVFLSIATNTMNDLDRWIAFVSGQCLGGVQLIAKDSFHSDFIKEFGIKSIPHFMLFDKDGKIITTNAPKPSTSTQICDIINMYI